MRGKIVNLCIACMNLLFGLLIIIYTIYVPQDKTLITVQENYVIKYFISNIFYFRNYCFNKFSSKL